MALGLLESGLQTEAMNSKSMRDDPIALDAGYGTTLGQDSAAHTSSQRLLIGSKTIRS
jgi:hypothetical protein